MKRTTLGRSGLNVSTMCLGTMTWGTQNTEAEGHAQIDRALAAGINFIDTAEMYPVNPVSANTIGRTEEIIGSWFARTGRRGEVVLATKMIGEGVSFVRDGAPIGAQSIRAAVEASLRRLCCEHIDLYQFHWPNRGGYHFRKHWTYAPSGQNRALILADMEESLRTLEALRAEGKIGHFGLSNESAWGMAQWLGLAEAGLGPRACTLQNEYSLLCRLYDTDLAELGVNEEVTLLAYSPLAAGLLTGKYAPDLTPPGSRRAVHPELGGRITPRVWDAIAAYDRIARDAGLDLVQMALAFIMARPFPAIPILGATSVAQLDRALGAAGLVLPDDVQTEIARAYKMHPLPF
jgi:aryl-alcohol dehydrogenase-like predicted oxidoreductase